MMNHFSILKFNVTSSFFYELCIFFNNKIIYHSSSKIYNLLFDNILKSLLLQNFLIKKIHVISTIFFRNDISYNIFSKLVFILKISFKSDTFHSFNI